MRAQFDASLTALTASDTVVLDPSRRPNGVDGTNDASGADTAILVAAFDLSPNGELLLDLDNAVIRANQRFALMWNLPAEAVTQGRRGLPQALTSRVINSGQFAAWLRKLERRPDIELHEEIVLADGRVVELHTTAITADDRRLRGRIWHCRDVTEQRRADARLLEAEETFRSVVEQDIAGICIIADDGRVAYANTTYARAFGYAPEQLIGRPLLDIVPASEKAQVAALVASHLGGNKTVTNIISTVTAMDGHLVDVLVHATGGTYRGRPASIAVVLDISERQQAKRELALAEIIVEQSPIVLFRAVPSKDFTTTYVSRNFARFGYGSADETADGFRFVDHLHAEDRTRVLAGLNALIAGATPLFDTDCRLITRDGATRWVHLRTVPILDPTGVASAVQGTVIDITDRKQAERSLGRVNRALRTLSSGNEVVVRATSERQLLDEMCRVLVEVGQYPRCWIGFAGAEQPPSIKVMTACGCDPGMIDVADTTAPLNALQTMRPAVVRGITEPTSRDGFTACIALPFTLGSKARGVLVLYAAAEDAFDADAVKLLSELANDLDYGVLSLRAHAARDTTEQRLRASMAATVQALVNTLEMRDPYTAGHQRRVATLAVAIASALGLPSDAVEGIDLAAMVHDVGKVQVPAEILTKPGKLTALEYQLVQTHAQAGYDVLKGIDFPWPVAQMVWQHHERLNGSGYPNGLSGDAILLGSRIIAVADVVETMMNHRPYRPALGRDAALAEIESGRGELFDPDVVDACVRLFREQNFGFA